MSGGSRVLIAGGGIGGLALGLTLHQLAIPFTVLEAVGEPKPLGVGINLQPNAVRELIAMGIGEADLDTVGIAVREWALVGLNGREIYAEPRGTRAGYAWPQYATHRGRFHMLLHDRLLERAGPQAIRTGCRVVGYTNEGDGVAALVDTPTGRETIAGTLLVGADGIHSAVRAQMHPDQPPVHWGGVMMWRGTSMARPVRSGSSFVGLGTKRQRVIVYPIGEPDPDTGLAPTNWIAEITLDEVPERAAERWFTRVPTTDFAHHFADWNYDWLDVPALIAGAEGAYENPMIDRDPVPTWVDGPVALMGDAAHAMYPTGSNGATQAIVDARTLGAMLVAHGLTPDALAAYDAKLCGPVSELVLRNRGDGPFGLLGLVDERCGGTFDEIDAVLPRAERDAFMADYKAAAGFAMATLNAAPPILEPHARQKGATA